MMRRYKLGWQTKTIAVYNTLFALLAYLNEDEISTFYILASICLMALTFELVEVKENKDIKTP